MFAPARSFFSSTHLADIAERIVVAGLFGYLAANLLTAFVERGGIDTLLLLVSEASVVLFILIRRSTPDMSKKPRDWLLALGGTALPLLALPSLGEPIAPVTLCIVLMLTGFVIQISAKLTLRRSFGTVAANRGVKIGGPYRFVRHPMYAGYVVTQAGFLLLHPSAWNLSIYAVALSFQIARIVAEERILSRDPAYRDFSASVRYRLLPPVF